MALSNPLASFVWGPGGAQLTPEDIARRRQMEAELVAKGVDTSPVGSWTQGLARVADAFAGSVRRGRLDAEQRQGLASGNAAFADIAKSMGDPTVSDAVPTAAGSVPIASAGVVVPGTPNDIQTQFLDTVKNGFDAGNGQKLAVTNPYGLAAIAATGKVESGYDPKNAGGTWNDGANNAGGIMSWNGPRLANLQKFAGNGNGTPEQQGQFFLQENPALIASLNNAKSVDEAQHLMNNAWAFKGYNQPGNSNAAHRLALANGYLPQFQGQTPAAAAIQQQAPNQVASLDPSAGMGSIPAQGSPMPGQPGSGVGIPVPQARPDMPVQGSLDPATASPSQMMSALGIDQSQPGYVDPRVSTAGQQAAPPLAPPVNIPSQPISNPVPQQDARSTPAAIADAVQNGPTPAPSPENQQIVQAMAAAPAAPPPGPSTQALVTALQNPWLSPGQKSVASALLQQQMSRQQAAYELRLKQADPAYQADLALKQSELAKNQRDATAPIVVGGVLVDRNTLKPVYQPGISATEQATLDATKARDAATQQNQAAQLQLDQDKFHAEVQKGQWQKLTDGRLYNETSGEFRDAPPPAANSIPMKPDDISGIRKEVQQLPSYKNLAQAAPIYQSMVETFGRNSKASDLNMVYGLGKIMDPTSVVREGEVDMARNTAAWPDYLRGALETLKGGAALDPQTRTAIMKEAHGRIIGYDNEFKQSMQQYQGIAKRYNINPDDIIPPIGEFPEVSAAVPDSSPPPAGVDAATWGVMTPEERKLWQK